MKKIMIKIRRNIGTIITISSIIMIIFGAKTDNIVILLIGGYGFIKCVTDISRAIKAGIDEDKELKKAEIYMMIKDIQENKPEMYKMIKDIQENKPEMYKMIKDIQENKYEMYKMIKDMKENKSEDKSNISSESHLDSSEKYKCTESSINSKNIISESINITCSQYQSNSMQAMDSSSQYKEKVISVSNNLDGETKLIISRLMNDVCSNILENPSQIKVSMRKILDTKKSRVNYDDIEYIETLKTNILYYTNLIEDIEELIKTWISNKYIPSNETCLMTIQKMQNKNKITNLSCAKNNHKLEVYNRSTFMNDKIEKLEFDYMYLNIYSNILYGLVDVILSNKKQISKLYEKNPSLVINHIKKSSNVYITRII